MRAGFRKQDGTIMLELEVTNNSGTQVGDFDIMFNKNPFGISITGAAG